MTAQVNVLMMGAANIWWVPLANIFGRRPTVLGNLLLLVFCSMWAGLTKSFGSLLAARTLMGVAAAPSDTSMYGLLAIFSCFFAVTSLN